jgi:hypothetical protein
MTDLSVFSNNELEALRTAAKLQGRISLDNFYRLQQEGLQTLRTVASFILSEPNPTPLSEEIMRIWSTLAACITRANFPYFDDLILNCIQSIPATIRQNDPQFFNDKTRMPAALSLGWLVRLLGAYQLYMPDFLVLQHAPKLQKVTKVLCGSGEYAPSQLLAICSMGIHMCMQTLGFTDAQCYAFSHQSSSTKQDWERIGFPITLPLVPSNAHTTENSTPSSRSLTPSFAPSTSPSPMSPAKRVQSKFLDRQERDSPLSNSDEHHISSKRASNASPYASPIQATFHRSILHSPTVTAKEHIVASFIDRNEGSEMENRARSISKRARPRGPTRLQYDDQPTESSSSESQEKNSNEFPALDRSLSHDDEDWKPRKVAKPEEGSTPHSRFTRRNNGRLSIALVGEEEDAHFEAQIANLPVGCVLTTPLVAQILQDNRNGKYFTTPTKKSATGSVPVFEFTLSEAGKSLFRSPASALKRLGPSLPFSLDEYHLT